MKKIALISCSKVKKDYTCLAMEMYSPSLLFSKSLRYCWPKYDHIYILSAKHHLLSLDALIEPYDLTINKFPLKDKKEWAAKTYSMMLDLGIGNENFDFYTGIEYYKHLSCHLKSHKNVLKGLGIGERLAFLS